MSPTEPCSEVLPSKLTDLEVLEFLAQQTEEVAIPNADRVTISATANKYIRIFHVHGYINGEYLNGSGSTISSAVAEAVQKIGDRAEKAKAKREQAARLIAEAEKLEVTS